MVASCQSFEPSPAELARVARVEALLAALAGARPAPIACHGYLRLRTSATAGAGAREREVLLGDRGLTAAGVTVIDWRSAPLAEVFFSCRPGEEYELELDDREIAGALLDRALIEHQGPALVAIAAERALERGADGGWRVGTAPALRLAARDPAARARTSSPILVPLDPIQRAAVDLPADRSLLVLGEAGFGKTTVALHRLAAMTRRAGAPERPYPALVLVPTGGLLRLYRRTLDRLGLSRIEVATCDEWLARQARRLFRGLPDHTSADGSAAVVRLKRHPALREVLAEIAARRVTRSPGRHEVPRQAVRDDLFHLFGDRALLERVAATAGGAITRRAIAEVIAHTKVQFGATTEAAHAHVDADRLVTVDGAAIDAGTPHGDADTIDPEDFAVLFEIHRLRTGGDRTRAGHLARYRHIVLDEAQELSALELAVIGRARAADGVLTVAGDHHQQTDDTAVFGGWPATLSELGAAGADVVTLEESYRCPPAVTALGRALFGAAPAGEAPTASAGEDSTAEAGPTAGADEAVVRARFASDLHLHAALVDGLAALQDADPRATVALICRTAPAARAMEASLRRGLPCRLSIDGDIDLEPGVHVTCVADVKGLEFDYVLLPDADAVAYPDTAAAPESAEARRQLYVAVTRTCHQLVLAAARPWSPLLPP